MGELRFFGADNGDERRRQLFHRTPGAATPAGLEGRREEGEGRKGEEEEQ